MASRSDSHAGRELVGDLSRSDGHNAQRVDGELRAEGGDVSTMLDALDTPDPEDRQSDAGACGKVRDWLRDNGIDPDKFRVYEHPEYGTVQIEMTAYLGDEFDRFVSLMQRTTGIGYDGTRNYCRPGWVASI